MNIPTVDFVANTLVFLIFAWFCSSLLPNKRPVLTTILGVLFLSIIPTLLTPFAPSVPMFIFAILSFWVYLWASYRGTIKEKILVYCLGYTCVTIGQAVTASIFGIIGLTYEKYAYHLMVVSSVFGFVLLYLVSRAWKSIKLVMSSGRFMSFFLLPVSQLLMMIVFVYHFSKRPDSTGPLDITADSHLALTFCVVFILSLLADALFLDGVVRLAQNIEERERLQALETESALSYEYIKSMESDITEMRKYRHDFINTLTAVQLAIESCDEAARQEALDIVRQLTKEVSSITSRRFCSCLLVNCLLSHEERRLTDAGIKCDLRAEVPERLGVNELDLCRVLTNMFDNACQSCQRIPDPNDRHISFNMRVCEGYLYISMRNTRPEEPLKLETTKEDKKHHGLGLQIIREIAERNMGELIILEEDQAVSVTATLKWAEE